jgi:hypothetical protein
MSLSTSTDKSRTIRRKLEVTAATGLDWLAIPAATKKPESIRTDFSDVGFDIECSFVVPASGFALQTNVVRDTRQYQAVGPWQSMSGSGPAESRPFDTVWSGRIQSADLLNPPHVVSNSIVGYAAGTLLYETHENAALICTAGQVCTFVDRKLFHFVTGGTITDAQRHSFECLVVDCELVGQVPSFSLGEPIALTTENAIRQRRRQQAKRSYQIAMAGLQIAEDARARAVEAESKVGIDWDDWEDDAS